MHFLKKLFGFATTPAQPRERQGSLTDNQIQVLDLHSPEIQKYLKTGDEASLRYPPFQKGWLATVPGRVLLDAQASKVRQIASGIGLPPTEFNRLILPVLDAFADFAHMLPASQAHHHRGPGGLLAHSLEVAVYALNACQVTSFDHDRYPAERIKRRDRWNVAAVLAALLHDVGKPLYDLRVTDDSAEKVWQPVANTIPEWAAEQRVERYFIHWNPNRHEIHKHLSTTMVERLLHKDLRLWIMEAGQDLYFEMISAIACEDEKRLLTGLVIKADSSSVETDLRKYGGDASGQSAMGIGVPVASIVVDAMRLLRSVGTWKVNETGQRVWVFGDGVYVVWAQGVRDITESLQEKGIKAVPRSADALGEMLLDHNIIERSPDGSIYWSVSPDLLNAGRSKAIKLKCVKLASHTLLFPFEPLPPTATGTVGEDEHQLRFVIGGSSDGQPRSALEEVGGDLASAPPTDGNGSVITPMFSLPGDDPFGAAVPAEIISAPVSVPDFSVPTGMQDPFNTLPVPGRAATSLSEKPVTNPSPVNAPVIPTPIKASPSSVPLDTKPNRPKTSNVGSVQLVTVDGTEAPKIKVIGANADVPAVRPGSIVVTVGNPDVNGGIRVGGAQAVIGQPAAQHKKGKKKKRGPGEPSSDAQALEVAPETDQHLLAASEEQAGSIRIPDSSESVSPKEDFSTESLEAESLDDVEYSDHFGDIDDEVLKLAGMEIPDRTLMTKNRVEPDLAAETNSNQLAEISQPVLSPQILELEFDEPELNVHHERSRGKTQPIVVSPDLAMVEEFGFDNFDAELASKYIGEIPAESPLTVKLPKEMARFTESESFEKSIGVDSYDLPSLAREQPDLADVNQQSKSSKDSFEEAQVDEFDLPLLSEGVLYDDAPEALWTAADVSLDASWHEDDPPPMADFDSSYESSFQDSKRRITSTEELGHSEEKTAPIDGEQRPVENQSSVNSAFASTDPHRLRAAISVQEGSIDTAIRVGQPRKPKAPLPISPVQNQGSQAAPDSSVDGVEMPYSPEQAAEYEAYLSITPDLSSALRWYAENLDKTVSMNSFKPFFSFEGKGFVADDIPALARAGWLWDDFTGTMTRKNQKGVLLTSYLGAVFEYLTRGKYKHSMAVARSQEEAQFLLNVARSAIAMCKEHEMNGRRVVTLQPRKLSEISNALQVDETTLKRALIATHQYLIVRNNHVIELMD
ncbi:MobH family relaxase [Pseudomonas sp. LS-2]|uniref:MobH family relaxase n=1 Tax=Pseudomonas sp. LS-2 TaxID=2315859 RepID=UPI000E7557CA|nr:MobH family relaxase [Pseudomonas sp. LS-2]RJX72619.1 hypothetical protein D3M70_30925 [Pseudomonas sp. LS-2]